MAILTQSPWNHGKKEALLGICNLMSGMRSGACARSEGGRATPVETIGDGEKSGRGSRFATVAVLCDALAGPGEDRVRDGGHARQEESVQA